MWCANCADVMFAHAAPVVFALAPVGSDLLLGQNSPVVSIHKLGVIRLSLYQLNFQVQNITRWHDARFAGCESPAAMRCTPLRR